MSKHYSHVVAVELALRKLLFARRHAPRLKPQRRRFDADRQKLQALFADPNFLGFAVSEKRVQEEGDRVPTCLTGEYCATFFVRRKLPEARLRAGTKIPKRLQLESVEYRVLTDVVELGKMHYAHGLSPGSLIAHGAGTQETVGTVTLLVNDVSTGSPLILGCSHVLAQAGAAAEGEAVESPPDPSGPSGPNIVGRLTDRFFVIDPATENQIDAALAAPLDGVRLSRAIPKIGEPSGVFDITKLSASQFMQLPVRKFGAKTGLTEGDITGFPATVPIRFAALGDRVAWFANVATYEIEAEEGDSGAAVVKTDSNDVVGMHIAGSGSSCVFTPIQPTLSSLQIVL